MKKPFDINIPQSTLDDMKMRLAATRWPDEVDNDNWEAGTNISYLKALCHYWQHDFDWKKQQAYLNSFANYRTNIDDLAIHYIYEKGKGETTIPILLIHGYPDNFTRFLKIIPLLTQAGENGFSFDVIVPSIPGYGFSDIPTEPGMDTRAIAGLFSKLMTEVLGYKKYMAHGGDWGGGITEQLALYHSDELLAIHLTDIPFQHAIAPVDNPGRAEKKFLDEVKVWQQKEGAYSMIQSTKPQSLAYGLNDSPAGLAGWVVEKFKTWSDNDGDLEGAFSKDELLTNLTIYWATQTINSAFRLYQETLKTIMNSLYNPLVKLNPFDKTGDKTKVPAAFALFPKDLSSPPREFAERYFSVQRWTEMAKGGHWGAMEQPQLLADDLRNFAQQINLLI